MKGTLDNARGVLVAACAPTVKRIARYWRRRESNPRPTQQLPRLVDDHGMLRGGDSPTLR